LKLSTLEPRDEVEAFVRRHLRDMDSTAYCLYMLALPTLERQQDGYGKPVLASQDSWAQACHFSRPATAKGLRTLAACGLIHLTPGDNGLVTGKRLASKVRRCSIEEIRSLCPREILERFAPPDAERLADVLNRRGVPWHGETISPHWFTTNTGRIESKEAIYRTEGHNTRQERNRAFVASLKPGEVLLNSDYSAAEPSILCHDLQRLGLLTRPVDPANIYEAILKAASVNRGGAKMLFNPYARRQKTRFISANRDGAKQLFNAIAYSPCRRLVIPQEWDLPPDHFLRDLIPALERYREHLWKHGRDTPDAPRHVVTLTGRRIEHDRKTRMHRGKPIAWRAQGTVADVLLSTIPAILEAEREGRCRFFFQAHDALFVAVPKDSDFNPAAIMEKAADDAGLPLRVKTTPHEHKP